MAWLPSWWWKFALFVVGANVLISVRRAQQTPTEPVQ
jgi:hypothetical protein